MADKNFKVKNGLDIGDAISISDAGVITGLDTDDLPVGTTNLYYLSSLFDADLATKTTDDLTEGTSNFYYTNARVDTRIALASIGDLSDVTIGTASTGELLYWDGAAWVDSSSITGAGTWRFERATGGTGSNAMFFVKRTRTGGGASNFQGPWIVGEYAADSFAGGPVGSINFLYQSTGGGASQTSGNLIRLTSHPLTSATQNRIADMQRGNFTFYDSTSGNNSLMSVGSSLTYDGCLNVDTFNFEYTGAGLNSFTLENTTAIAPALALIHARTDITSPANGDRVDFRLITKGTAGSVSLGKVEAQYNVTGDYEISLNVFDGSTNTTTQDVVRGQMTQVKIRAADDYSGAGITDVATFAKANTTLQTENLYIKDTSGVELYGSHIHYNRINGEFSSDVTQTTAGSTNETVTFNTARFSNGISIVNSDEITFAYDNHNYLLTANLSFLKGSGGSSLVYVWLAEKEPALSEVVVANSRSTLAINGNDGRSTRTLTWTLNPVVGEYYKIYWYTTDSSIELEAEASGVPVAGLPAAPSAIIQVTPVGA